MNITQVCEGCGEEFNARHSAFCAHCEVVHIGVRRAHRQPRQGNDRNREAKLREKSKRRKRVAAI